LGNAVVVIWVIEIIQHLRRGLCLHGMGIWIWIWNGSEYGWTEVTWYDTIRRDGQSGGRAAICICLQRAHGASSSPSPCLAHLSMSVHHNGWRTSSGRASALDYMAGRHLVGQLSLLLPFAALDPWALTLCLRSYTRLIAPSHACSQQQQQQATPVRTKVTARPRPRPITARLHSRVPEPA
jgi:hypothetical protein